MKYCEEALKPMLSISNLFVAIVKTFSSSKAF